MQRHPRGALRDTTPVPVSQIGIGVGVGDLGNSRAPHAREQTRNGPVLRWAQ